MMGIKELIHQGDVLKNVTVCVFFAGCLFYCFELTVRNLLIINEVNGSGK